MFELAPQNLVPIISQALIEDQGSGDITTEAIVDRALVARGNFLAKKELVLAGWPVVVEVFRFLSQCISSEVLFDEGETIVKGAVIGRIQGPAYLLLAGERVALNFLQRLCGIATYTRRLVQAVEGTGVGILDTRKTTPGLRLLEKYAVRVGGGVNHRFGLYDGVLIKENHVTAAGGIKRAVQQARSKVGHLHKIEIEISNMQELEEALQVGVEVVLLDNMNPEDVRESVARIQGKAVVEVSGGIDLRNIRNYAVSGVDFISIGALTHSIKAADISLELEIAL